MAGEHTRERALAGAVRSHDGVHFAGADAERQALQNVLALGAGAQIANLKHHL